MFIDFFEYVVAASLTIDNRIAPLPAIDHEFERLNGLKLASCHLYCVVLVQKQTQGHVTWQYLAFFLEPEMIRGDIAGKVDSKMCMQAIVVEGRVVEMI